MTGGRAIRWSTVAAVAGVSLVAGWVSAPLLREVADVVIYPQALDVLFRETTS